MTSKYENRFLNFHILTSYSPSCLNRDDMNMQKSALFGGVRRVRVSSQCLKRSIRQSELYRKFFGKPSLRTASPQMLLEHLQTDENFSSIPSEILECVIEVGMKEKTITPWISDEISELAKIVDILLKNHGKTYVDLPSLIKSESKNDEEGTGKSKKKGSGDSKFMKELRDKYSECEKEFAKAGISCVDIALSGRMCASGELSNVEAALSVAHAISTHAMDAEIDWFTAMDDLKTLSEETGAGYLNTQEFSSAVFYLYSSIDIELLAKNIGGDEKDALSVASKYLELMATVSPTAKQTSFASYTPAHCILTLRSPLPISLANAFEKPVKLGGKGIGFITPSMEAMKDYWVKVHSRYEIPETGAFFCIDDFNLDNTNLTLCSKLSDMKKWIEEGSENNA